VTEVKTITSNSWSVGQALTLAAFSLLLGTCGGWLIRRSIGAPMKNSPDTMRAPAVLAMPANPTSFSSVPAIPSEADVKQAADTQATPLLEQLKADPNNAGLLAQVGNLYYDAKQYAEAIEYYERALKAQPDNTSVRTDLGTAYWYKGDANTAIREFERALAVSPTKADTLFNLGIVKWQGKRDAKGAVAAWQKLLDRNPDYPNRENVRELIAQIQNR
jgi:tetratricopeptide (TPR) repeat protein